tara:strand:+ start:357 stop:875 length:519 start_codon:yes stop_codon:yes gene_type:complete
MATTIEILNGISQALANKHDGALDDKGEPISIGLAREEGEPLIDKRVMDGFTVKMHGGDKLCLYYHTECLIKDVHAKNFESDTESALRKVKKFLQSEYKKATGNALTLTKDGDARIEVEYISRIRTVVKAYQVFKVGGLVSNDKDREYKIDSAIKDWLSLKGNKKPKNVTRS